MKHCSLAMPRRHTVPLIALVASALLAQGCATGIPTAVSPAVDDQTLGRIAVVTTADVPTVELDGFPPPDTITDPAQAGVAGAAGGAVAGAIGCVLGGASAGLGPLGAAIGVALMPACAVVGAIAVGTAATKDTAQAPDSATAHRQANALFVQDALRRSIEAAMRAASIDIAELPENGRTAVARDYAALAARRVDTVLEVQVRKFGTFVPDGRFLTGDRQPMSEIRAAIRLVRTRDGGEVYAANVDYVGRWRTVEEWLVDQGRPLVDDLGRGIEKLGRMIHEDVFVIYHFPDRMWCATTSRKAFPAQRGLAPLDPPVRGRLDEHVLTNHYDPRDTIAETLVHGLLRLHEWATVESHQPRLVWEAFPRERDRISAPEDMARVTDVRYELVITREEGLGAAELVYRRDGITTPEHVVELPLPPKSRFFWTVRARFTLDGRERVTEWGSWMWQDRCTRRAVTEYVDEYVFGPYWITNTPSLYSYRFKTGP